MINNTKRILGVHYITFYLLPTNPLWGWAVKIPTTSKFTFDYYKHINKVGLVSTLKCYDTGPVLSFCMTQILFRSSAWHKPSSEVPYVAGLVPAFRMTQASFQSSAWHKPSSKVPYVAGLVRGFRMTQVSFLSSAWRTPGSELRSLFLFSYLVISLLRSAW